MKSNILKFSKFLVVLTAVACGGKSDKSNQKYPKINSSNRADAGGKKEKKASKFVPVFLTVNGKVDEKGSPHFWSSIYEVSVQSGTNIKTIYKDLSGKHLNLMSIVTGSLFLGEFANTGDTVQRVSLVLSKDATDVTKGDKPNILKLANEYDYKDEKGKLLSRINIDVQLNDLSSEKPIILNWNLDKIKKNGNGLYQPEIYTKKNFTDPKLKRQLETSFVGTLKDVTGNKGSYTARLESSYNSVLFLDFQNTALKIDTKGNQLVEIKEGQHALVRGKFSLEKRGLVVEECLVSNNKIENTDFYDGRLVDIDIEKGVLKYQPYVFEGISTKETTLDVNIGDKPVLYNNENNLISAGMLKYALNKYNTNQATFVVSKEVVKNNDNKPTVKSNLVFAKTYGKAAVEEELKESTAANASENSAKPDEARPSEDKPDDIELDITLDDLESNEAGQSDANNSVENNKAAESNINEITPQDESQEDTNL